MKGGDIYEKVHGSNVSLDRSENEEEARKILDNIEIDSPHEDSIFWNSLTEVEEEPDL